KIKWRFFLRFIAAAGCLSAGYGILQWLNLDVILPPGLRAQLIAEFGGAYRSIGTIGQPTSFANYLQFPLFCAIALVGFDSNRWWRRFGFFGAVVVMLALFATMTRGAILGMAAGMVVLPVACAEAKRRR